jgi:hypothetical protein
MRIKEGKLDFRVVLSCLLGKGLRRIMKFLGHSRTGTTLW